MISDRYIQSNGDIKKKSNDIKILRIVFIKI